MFQLKACLVIHRDRNYFGTIEIDAENPNVITVGSGAERFICDASTIIQKPGYDSLNVCPEGTINCDAVYDDKDENQE